MAKSSSASSSISSASKLASGSGSSAASVASDSLSSASKAASVTGSSAASVASKSLSSASAKASAAAADAYAQSGTSGSSTMTLVTAVVIVFTVVAVALGGLYMSGYADDMMMYYAKKYYSAKAQAEMTVMENVGEGKAKDFVKGQLKKNPLLGEDELDKIAPGLGQEAKAEGLAGVSDKLGSLGGGKFGL